MIGEEFHFELPGSAHVLFTDRRDGNMSSTQGEDSASAAHARAALLARTGARELAHARQVHGTTVRRWELGDLAAVGDRESADGDVAAVGEGASADGHVTADPGLALMVLTADCLPVCLASPSAVGVLHAGWRGLAAGILERGLVTLEAAGSARSPQVVAVLGPCAGACCYEVGPEVHTALGESTAARGMIDLRGIARRRLLAAGVHSVLDVPACTICDPRLFSHRREGSRAGRQAGAVWRS